MKEWGGGLAESEYYGKDSMMGSSASEYSADEPVVVKNRQMEGMRPDG